MGGINHATAMLGAAKDITCLVVKELFIYNSLSVASTLDNTPQVSAQKLSSLLS